MQRKYQPKNFQKLKEKSKDGSLYFFLLAAFLCLVASWLVFSSIVSMQVFYHLTNASRQGPIPL